jgi:hypothetical protein
MAIHRLMSTAHHKRLRRLARKPAGAEVASVWFSRHKVYVHPCLIDNQPHIVYPRGLQTHAPLLFRHLCDYYRGKGYALKEDQRCGDRLQRPAHERRRRWAPIILFTTGLMLESAAFADTQNEPQSTFVHAPQQNELQLLSRHAAQDPAGEIRLAPKPSLKAEPASIDSGVAIRIYDILRQHYQRHAADPDCILDDFKEIASYYSGFPEVMSMLESLNGKKWALVYREHNWATVASGNAFQVDSAQIHFNTRSAAQLKLYRRCEGNPVCIASPADALLHELLHTRSMLVNTGEFLAQGGMSSVLYPYKHEYAVIDAERKLYASMSLRDNLKRPQRYDHTGRFVKAQCATCIQ